MQAETLGSIRAGEVWDYWDAETSPDSEPTLSDLLVDCVEAEESTLRDSAWDAVMGLRSTLLACANWRTIKNLVLPIYEQCEHMDVREIGGWLMRRFPESSPAEKREIGEFLGSLEVDRLLSLGKDFKYFVVEAVLATLEDFGHVAVVFGRILMRLVDSELLSQLIREDDETSNMLYRLRILSIESDDEELEQAIAYVLDGHGSCGS